MKVSEALGRWSEACAAVELKGQIVRDGNWQPIQRALRHYTDESAAIELVEEHGSSSILKIKPAEVDPETVPAGKSAAKRPAFLLIVT